MHNKILHALSNRPGPFVTPLFSRSPSFVPHKAPPDELVFRNKLFLNVTTSDYYLKSYLALLHSFSDIERLFEDDLVTYRIEDFPPRGVMIEGAEFVSSPNTVGYFTDPVVTALPINQIYEVRYYSSTYLDLFAIETGLTRRTAYHASGTSPNKILRFDWMDFPFQGPIQLNQEWAVGAKVTIAVEPSHFPVEVLWNVIRGDLWLVQNVTNQGLMDALSGTMDIQEKVAIALMILILANDVVFGEAPAPLTPLFESATPPVWPRTSIITITTATPLPDAHATVFYSLQFQATGGTGRYKWSIVSGSLPAGLNFSEQGLLSGTPTGSGSVDFDVMAVDY